MRHVTMRAMLGACLMVCSEQRGIAQAPGRAQSAPRIVLRPAAATLDEEFSGIVGVRELADGRVLVVDATEGRVVVADFMHGTVTQIGRTGQGPGEYQNPRYLFRLGADSTLLVEQRTSRWHLLVGAQLAGTLPADDPAYTAARRLVSGADGRGNIIRAVAFTDPGQRADSPPESSSVLRVNRGSGRLDTVARVRAVKSVINTTTSGGRVTMVTVFRPPFAVGEELAMFEDGWIAIARLDPYRVDWISPDGRATTGAALPWPVSKVTREDLRLFYSARRGAGNPQGEAALERYVEGAMQSVPDAVPPFSISGLIPIEDGRLLVPHPQTAAFPTARYDVVDRRGRLTGAIALPAGEAILAISRRFAYVVVTDEDGIQHLRRHPWP